MATGASPPSGLLSLVSVSPTTYGSSTRQKELSRVGLSGLRKLCALLRNEGHRVLGGQSDFTLTSDVLSHLLVSCRRHSVLLSERASAVPDPPIRTPTFVINRGPSEVQNFNSSEEEWNRHIQFIKDFMLSTPNLKIIHNQGTLSFPISLHRFGNINKLQLRRIPIHMVEGLQMHRQSLESLAVYRGVNALKDLLECCGGDRSAPSAWPRLKALSLMFNTIPDLDDSLRLLPHVESLDLSHNCLEKCDVYLEYLGDLVFISLAYNLLTSVPSFSLSSRASLVSLVLRGNNLDHIKGIENLTTLVDLDLGENCISDHSFLEPLAHLTRLSQLQLDANPLFYHRRHRKLTASCLSRQALNSEFELDKKKLTLSEITYYSPRQPQHKTKPASVQEDRSVQQSSTPERRPSFSSGIGTEVESDIVVKSPRRSKRKRLKPRHTEILDTSGDFTSSRDASPGTTPHFSEVMRMRTEEALRTKEQVEELRRHYGPNWLQAIEDRNIFSQDKPDARPMSDEASKSDSDSIGPSGKIKAGKAKSKTRERLSRPNKVSPLASEPTSKTDTEDESVVKSGDERVTASPLKVEDVPEGKSAGSTTCPSDSDAVPNPKKKEVANPIMAALARLAAQQSEGELDPALARKVEEAQLVEPMVATLPLEDNKMILLSWSASYLLEKDIKDKLTEKLELGALLSVESSTASTGEGQQGGRGLDSGGFVGPVTEPQGCGGEEKIELTLKFDYIHRDRQKRLYLLDAVDSKALKDYLQPFLDARLETARSKLAAVMQCLKCNRTFLKKDVLKKEKKLPSAGNLQDLKALQELMNKTTFLCPKCGSSMVIDYTPPASTVATASTSSQHGKSASSTPVGSFTSTDGFMDRMKQQRRPAKLSRKKSSDRFDLSGGRVSQLVRKDSSGSLDVSPSRKSSVRSTGSATKDSRTSSIDSSARDRSNAFSANKMSRSVAVTKRERSVSEQGDLRLIEDYFEEEIANTDVTSSKALAAMTTSLRGDPSTTGSAATVVRTSLQETSEKGSCVPESQARSIENWSSQPSNDMADSGFLSGVNSSSLDQDKLKGVIGSGPSSEHGEGSVIVPVQRDSQKGVKSELEREAEGRKRKASVSSQHKHISAMEELVNSMVREGHSLGSLESQGQRSMSVSAFRDLVSSSPSNNRRERTGSRTSSIDVDAVPTSFQRSDSASSIAVISHGNSIGDDDASGIISFTLSNGLSIAEAGDEGRLPISVEGEDEAVPRVVSPLSSDICSSMVSSVYESSVRTVTENGANGINGDLSSRGSAEITETPTVIEDDSNSSDDMTSIYDLPTKPKKSRSKKNLKVHSKSARLTSSIAEDSNDHVDGGKSLLQSLEKNRDDSCDSNLGRNSEGCHCEVVSDSVTFKQQEGVVNPDDLNGQDDVDSDSETEVLSELDVTPQYAFHHLNHRLTLYLMMTLFEPHEEFVCKIQGEFSQYIIDESYEGIFVMSSDRFYILKIISEDHTQDPSQWVNCIEIQPIPELRYIDLGLGGQSLRLEFVTDCSSYTIITRNRDRTAQFIEVLHTNLAKYAVSNGIASHVVVNEDVDQTTLDNLDKEVLCKVNKDQTLLLYCMGFIQRGISDRFPVSFVIGSNDICLVRTSHQWPQPRLQAPITVETVGRQFVVLERQLVNNVASVNVDEASMRKISLELFNEKEGVSTHWNISMASRQTTLDFVQALSIPWEREFGVEMDVCYSELDF